MENPAKSRNEIDLTMDAIARAGTMYAHDHGSVIGAWHRPLVTRAQSRKRRPVTMLRDEQCCDLAPFESGSFPRAMLCPKCGIEWTDDGSGWNHPRVTAEHLAINDAFATSLMQAQAGSSD